VTTRLSPAEDTIDRLDAAREGTLALVAGIADAELERVHSTLMSPLVWDLGHIAAFEDLWLVHRHGGEPMVRRDLAEVYDAFETPRAGRGELPFLRAPQAREYLAEVRARTRKATERVGPGDGVRHELVLRHELQHAETMLQTIGLARLEGCARLEPDRPAPGSDGLDLVDVPGGEASIGAGEAGFAYDNERPRHRVRLRPFRIGRAPVTNATWLGFAEGGGYRRREWWTDEAWHWKEQYDITHPLHWSGDGREWRAGRWEPLRPDRPVVHVSWFEADAFARAHGARLPTEAEWERAATWDQGTGPTTGRVWEWTASEFSGYPGFAAFPYREYSEVFFDSGYRVLRGGSWASSPRVATATFRNWDLPPRRQIFAGVRIARDA